MTGRALLGLLLVVAGPALTCSRHADPQRPEHDDRRLIRHLTPREGVALCSWVKEVAQRRLPPDGMRVLCQGEMVAFRGGTPRCDGYQGVGDDCVATLGDVRACYPALFAHVANHPCEWMTLASEEDYDRFIGQVPACTRQNACRYFGDRE